MDRARAVHTRSTTGPATPLGETKVPKYVHRFYRNYSVTGTVPFVVKREQSDLFIRADSDLSLLAAHELAAVRLQLESYIAENPLFERSLVPLNPDMMAPKIVRDMLQAGLKADVGPMAAVAGAIAQQVGYKLREKSTQVIVENGGDLFLALDQDLSIGIFAGKSPLSGKVALKISSDQTPCGLCTSSGTVGYSLSKGRADAVTILAKSAALADAVATAAGNRMNNSDDIQKTIEYVTSIDGVIGTCIIIKDKLGIQGDLELLPIE